MRVEPPLASTPGRSVVPYLVLVVSLCLSGVATFSAARLFHTRDALQFTNGIQQTQDAIERRLGTYIEMLVLGSALYGASREVTPAEFQNYVQALRVNERYPGIQGIGFSMRIPRERKEEIVQQIRQERESDFEIWPEQGQEEYNSIVFLEPLDDRNRRAIGFDMHTEPVREAAMDRARDSGLPAASGRVKLVQETDEGVQPGFLIYVPVYEGGKNPPTVEGRRRSLLGFVYSPFRAGDLLRGIFGDENRLPVDFRVFDGPTRSKDHLLYQSPRSTQATEPPRFERPRALMMAGRTWTLEFASGASLEATSGKVVIPFLALGGIAVSFALFRLTSVQAAAYAALEKSASALRASQADLAASEELQRMVTDEAVDSIISLDERGRIRSVNPATEEIFGYSAEELRGMAIGSLIPDLPSSHWDGASLASAAQDLELDGLHKSGRAFPIEVSLSAYARQGNRSCTAVIRNITQRKQAEAAQKRRAEFVTLRAEVSAAFGSAGASVPEVLRVCAEAIVRRVPAAFAGIWTLNKPSHQLELRASAGLPVRPNGPQAKTLGQPEIGRVLAEKQPFLSNDLPGEMEASARPWAGEERLISFAGHPLLVEGEAIGVLALFGREPLPADTLEILAVLADLMAQGMERKRIERHLRESEERLRVAVESAELGTWELNPATGELRWSARTKALFGLPPDVEITYEAFLAGIYPEDKKSVLAAVESALDPKSDGQFEVDFRAVWPDGTVRWIAAKGRVFFEEQQAGERRAVRFSGTALDLTRRKQQEETSRFLAEAGSVLSESLNFEDTLAKLARLAVPRVADLCAVDRLTPGGAIETLAVVHEDPAKAEMARRLQSKYPFDPDLDWGVPWVIRSGRSELHPSVPDSILTKLARSPEHLKLLRELGMKSILVVPIKARDRVFGTLSFLFCESGRRYTTDDLDLAEGLALRAGLAIDNALLYRAAHQEIAERKKVEQEIHQLNQDLEERVRRRTTALQESNEQLEAFTYTVAHDLRAPLRAMQGFSQALLDDYAAQLDAPGRDYAARVTSAAQRMDALIQDLLAYSRLSRIQLATEPIELETIVRRVLSTFSNEIKAKGALIEVVRPLLTVQAHATTLEQVLSNLLSNALKFVSPGVTPRIRLQSERRGDAVCVAVHDNGIGVETEYQERIFRVFERLHGSETFPGTGIGLAIVRKGVERMGGRAGVESNPGLGSRFWIELPYVESPPKEPRP